MRENETYTEAIEQSEDGCDSFGLRDYFGELYEATEKIAVDTNLVNREVDGTKETIIGKGT